MIPFLLKAPVRIRHGAIWFSIDRLPAQGADQKREFPAQSSGSLPPQQLSVLTVGTYSAAAGGDIPIVI
jgi:hypothetical protein